MSAGFRILERVRKVSAQDVKNFAAIPVANISDSMARMTAAGARLRAASRRQAGRRGHHGEVAPG
jgi:hypothetical protein